MPLYTTQIKDKHVEKSSTVTTKQMCFRLYLVLKLDHSKASFHYEIDKAIP